MQDDILFKFSLPSGAPRRAPSKAMTDALGQLAETEEMKPLLRKARAQRRQVVIEVFHSKNGEPILIHPKLQPRQNG